MEFINKNPKIFILSGKAKSGKNLVADIIEEYYSNKKCIQISYAYYLKQYAKKISNWDGREENKPRELLQSLGIEFIKNKIDDSFLIRRLCEDIKVYSYFFDIIIITDARLIDEVIVPKKLFNGITIRINRNDYENGLSNKEKVHITETELDNYNHFDYIIENSDNLNKKVNEVLESVKI